MLYFVKDNKLHRYPVPKRCLMKRENEQLRDTIPKGDRTMRLLHELLAGRQELGSFGLTLR